MTWKSVHFFCKAIKSECSSSGWLGGCLSCEDRWFCSVAVAVLSAGERVTGETAGTVAYSNVTSVSHQPVSSFSDSSGMVTAHTFGVCVSVASGVSVVVASMTSSYTLLDKTSAF